LDFPAVAHDAGSSAMNTLNRAVRLLGAGGARQLRRNVMTCLSNNNEQRTVACYASSSQAASNSPTAAATSGESWDRVLDILSSLIKHKTRADGKNWRDAHENMPVYLKVGSSVQQLAEAAITSNAQL
jgi:hypothetical protein